MENGHKKTMRKTHVYFFFSKMEMRAGADMKEESFISALNIFLSPDNFTERFWAANIFARQG